jgi:uncharacterized protein YndB with AHSA1/START domain
VSFTPYTLDPTRDLELVREVDVPPSLVFRAWTTPELLKRWFAPKPFETPEAEVDLRPGGIFRTVMRSPDGQEFDGTGCVLEVVPDQRFVWTGALGPGFRPQPAEMPFTGIIELEPTPSGGTRYRAIAVHQSEEDNRKHAEMGFVEGWGTCLDQLVEVVKAL